jgi:putative hemolysin
MSESEKHEKIFNLDLEVEGTLRKSLFRVARKPLERLLSFHGLNNLYNEALHYQTDQAFYDKLLDRMNVTYHISERDMGRIPKEGRVIVVANHPFGGLEGIILASILRSAREDSKILANYLLECIPELREVFFFVDPFGSSSSARANLSSMKNPCSGCVTATCWVFFPPVKWHICL